MNPLYIDKVNDAKKKKRLPDDLKREEEGYIEYKGKKMTLQF